MSHRLPTLLLMSLISVAGCSQLALLVYRPAAIEECPGPLPPIDAAGADFVRRLRVQVESADVAQGFDVILQKRGGQLTLVGLTRFGARAFSVVQAGGDITVDSAMKQIEAVPPLNILRDLHRWPLQTIATDGSGGVQLDTRGNTATLINQPCGYRATIVDLGGTESGPGPDVAK